MLWNNGETIDFYIYVKGADYNLSNNICAAMRYNIADNKLYLESILYNVDEKNECRIGISGTSYIVILFNIAKNFIIWHSRKPNATLPIFELQDEATIKNDNKLETYVDIEGYSDDQLSLSAYKLLTKGISFYENYGFIPQRLFTESAKIDDSFFKGLDDYLTIRKNILSTAFTAENTINYLKTIDKIKLNISLFEYLLRKIDELLSMIKNELRVKTDNDNTKMINLVSLPDNYSLMTLFAMPDSSVLIEKLNQQIKTAIKDIIHKLKSYIYTLILLYNKGIEGFYIHPITTNENIARIELIYKKHGLIRNESYCNYLTIDKLKPQNNKLEVFDNVNKHSMSSFSERNKSKEMPIQKGGKCVKKSRIIRSKNIKKYKLTRKKNIK